MINDKIKTSLEQLEKNLQQIASAKKQLSTYENVSKQLIESISLIESVFADYQKELTNKLNVQLTEIKNSVSNLISEISDLKQDTSIQIDDYFKKQIEEFDKIKEEYQNSLNSVTEFAKSEIENYKNQSTDIQRELLGQNKETVNEIKHTIDTSISEFQQINKQLNEAINKHLEKYDFLVKTVEVLIEKIGKVNFPDRLDKIDNTISSINIGILNLQTTLNDSEKRIIDVLTKNKDSIDELKIAIHDLSNLLTKEADIIKKEVIENSNQNTKTITDFVLSTISNSEQNVKSQIELLLLEQRKETKFIKTLLFIIIAFCLGIIIKIYMP